jgi:stage IV sporulation protein FB
VHGREANRTHSHDRGGIGQYGVVFSFRLLGVRVTVQTSFLLVAAVLGLSGGSLTLVVTWVVVVFVSILVHEMGHALTARSFGAQVQVELNGIGGLTSWGGNENEMGPGRRALIAAAGSATGVAFGALIWLASNLSGPHGGVVGFTLDSLVWVNVFWGLLNWLPIRPLDGGHLLISLLQKTAPTRVTVISNAVFLATTALAVALGIWLRLYLVALLAGWLLLGELTRGRGRRPPTPIPPMTFDRPDAETSSDTEGGDG